MGVLALLALYIPVCFYGLYLAMRSRSLTFFTCSNPGMEHGGFVDYSKINILRPIDPRYLPTTIYLDSLRAPPKYSLG